RLPPPPAVAQPPEGRAGGRGRVVTGRRAEVTLPTDVTAPRLARRFVADTVTSWGAHDLVETAKLLASELVTNALRHAGGARLLVVQENADCIRLEVVDHGRGGARRRSPRIDDIGGRGLVLVEAMAARWGASPSNGAHVVWCEMSR